LTQIIHYKLHNQLSYKLETASPQQKERGYIINPHQYPGF